MDKVPQQHVPPAEPIAGIVRSVQDMELDYLDARRIGDETIRRIQNPPQQQQ